MFSPACSSLAHTSSAMTRGSVPIRAPTLRGTASARDGVEPAGEPLPFLAVAEERPGGHEHVGLGARGDRFPGAAVQVVAALDVVADRHPVDGCDPGRAGLPRPLPGLGDLGMLSCQPPSGLGDDGADDRADLRGQRRGGVPPLDPPGPRGIGSLDAGRVVVAGAHRRIAVAERGDHTLQRVKRRLVLAARGGGVGVQPGERPGGQVGQAGTAVDQQRLGRARRAACTRRRGPGCGSPSGPAPRSPRPMPPRRPRRRRRAGPGAAG